LGQDVEGSGEGIFNRDAHFKSSLDRLGGMIDGSSMIGQLLIGRFRVIGITR
jgi:hypothetical protein